MIARFAAGDRERERARVRGKSPKRMGGVLRDKTNLALETQIARLTAVYYFPFCLNVAVIR